MKTAIAQVKKKVLERINYLKGFDNDHAKNRIAELTYLLTEIVYPLEPVNEHQIKDAFDDGEKASYDRNVRGLDVDLSGENYFTKTFEK